MKFAGRPEAYLGRSVRFAALIRWLSLPRARPIVIVASLTMVAAVAGADLWTGPVVSLALLYLVPVMAMAWTTGRRGGFATAAAAGLAGFAAFVVDAGSLALTVGAWNSVVRTMMFITVVWLVDSQRQMLQEHYSAAMVDSLTGVMTRRAFYTAGERLLRRAERHHLPASLLYADLDRLKQANDNHGHEAGDEMIAHFARVANGLLRESDLVARIGGDEFAILMFGVRAIEAVEFAERLAIRLLEDTSGPALSASIGVTSHDRASADIEQLVREADDAMYEAKRAGGAAIRLRVSIDVDDDRPSRGLSRRAIDDDHPSAGGD